MQPDPDREFEETKLSEQAAPVVSMDDTVDFSISH